MKKEYVLLRSRKYHKKKSKLSKIIKLLKNKKFIIPFFTFSILLFTFTIIFFRKSSSKQKKETALNFVNNTQESTIIPNTENILLNISNASSITLNNTNEAFNTIKIIFNNSIIDSSYQIINITNETFNIISNINISNIQNLSNINDKKENAPNPLGKLLWRNNPTASIMTMKQEIKSFSNYQISFTNESDFIKRENPKVSIVLAVHDQQKDIKTIYASIQRQELKDIEIIFVDDNSKDNTSFIIKSLMEKDKRIVYLKNEENRRAFYSRNRGILQAKGEYILAIDPDDLLLNNILLKAYETAKKYDLDMVQFYALLGYFQTPRIWRDLKRKGGIIKGNKEIRENFYNCMSRNLWDKLVRREVYIKSVNFMKDEFKNELYVLNNDDTAFFGLLHVVESYGFLEDIGYFYILRPRGVTYYRNDPKNTNAIFRSIFNNMRYFYIQSDDTTADKSNLAYKYFDKNYKVLKKNMVNLSTDFDFMNDVLDLYINSNYFNESQKNKLKEIKNMINERKKKVNEKK